MRLVIAILILNVGVLLTGCEKVINADLDTAPPKLVIDASIDWRNNTSGKEQKIVLSTTTGYYNSEIPTVSGATVFINNSANTEFNFTETSNAGEYTCTDFEPVIGETYKLTVVLNEATYSAVETFIGTPEIDSAITQNNSGGMTGDEIEIQFSFQDDGAHDNYYMIGVGSNRVAFPEFELESDERYQGNRMLEFYSHEDLKKSDSLNITLYGVSKRFFDYFTKILTASGNNSSPFPTLPTAVRGNIVNQTDAENYPLGYFRLSEVTTRNYTIH
jgi:hypothetical protein